MADRNRRRTERAREIRRTSPGRIRHDDALRIADALHSYEVWLSGRSTYLRLIEQIAALAPTMDTRRVMDMVANVWTHVIDASELIPVADETIGIVTHHLRPNGAALTDAWDLAAARVARLQDDFGETRCVWSELIKGDKPGPQSALTDVELELALAFRLLDVTVTTIERSLLPACDTFERLAPLLEHADATVVVIDIDRDVIEPVWVLSHQLELALHCSRRVLLEAGLDHRSDELRPRPCYRSREDRAADGYLG